MGCWRRPPRRHAPRRRQAASCRRCNSPASPEAAPACHPRRGAQRSARRARSERRAWSLPAHQEPDAASHQAERAPARLPQAKPQRAEHAGAEGARRRDRGRTETAPRPPPAGHMRSLRAHALRGVATMRSVRTACEACASASAARLARPQRRGSASGRISTACATLGGAEDAAPHDPARGETALDEIAAQRRCGSPVQCSEACSSRPGIADASALTFPRPYATSAGHRVPFNST